MFSDGEEGQRWPAHPSGALLRLARAKFGGVAQGTVSMAAATSLWLVGECPQVTHNK